MAKNHDFMHCYLLSAKDASAISKINSLVTSTASAVAAAAAVPLQSQPVKK